MRALADLDVWIATLHEGHPHHAAATAWWRQTVVPADGTILFCRITQLGLLRLLCNERVMGASRLGPEAAWSTYRQLLAQPPVKFAEEPSGIDEVLAELTAGRPRPRPGSGRMPASRVRSSGHAVAGDLRRWVSALPSHQARSADLNSVTVAWARVQRWR